MRRSRKPRKSNREIARLREEYLPLLGKVTDLEIARRAGVCHQTAHKWRRDAGIEALANVGAKLKHWTPEKEKLLGTMPDRKLAKVIGIPTSTIYARRKALGIPPCKMRDRPRGAHLIPIDSPKIRARRLKLGLTFEAAGDGNKTRISQLAKIEKGLVTAVTEKTLQWLCEALKCKAKEISAL